MNNAKQIAGHYAYTINKLIIAVTCVLMLVSLYIPFSSTVSYIYQIIVVGVIVLLGKGEIESIIPLLVLSTTRSYIAVSTNSETVSYLGINGIMLSIALAGILLYSLLKSRMKIKVNLMYALLFVFAVIMALSSIFTINRVEYNDYYIPICLTYIILPLLFTSDKAVFISKVAFAIAGAWLAIGIVPHLMNIGDIYQSAVQVDRNYQSCFLIICILQSLILLSSKWQHSGYFLRFGLIVVILFDTYILLTSASRSAFIALVFGILLYCFLNVKNFKKLFGFLLVLCIVIYISGEFGLFDTIFSRFALEDVSSGNGRYILWKKYMEGIFNSNFINFFFGHGLTGQTVYGKVAHNLFISIFYSYGCIGFLIIVALVTWSIFIFVKTKQKNELVVFLPAIIECMSLEPYYRMEFAIYFALIIGAAIFYGRKKVK